MQSDSTVRLGCVPIVYLFAKYFVAVVLLVMQLLEINKATFTLQCVSWCVLLVETKQGVGFAHPKPFTDTGSKMKLKSKTIEDPQHTVLKAPSNFSYKKQRFDLTDPRQASSL